MFIEETQHFLACIESHRAPAITLRDGAQSLRMALAAKQSLEKGIVVAKDVPGFVAGLAKIARTCAEWDGTDPVRILTRDGYRTP